MSEGAAQITYRLGWVALVGFWGGIAVLVLFFIAPRRLVEKLGWVGDAFAHLIFSGAYFGGFASLIGAAAGLFAILLLPETSPGRAQALSGLLSNGAVLFPWLLLMLLWSGHWPPPRPFRPTRELPRLSRGRRIGIAPAKYRVSATSEAHEVLALVPIEDSVIDGLPCRAGTEVSFDPSSGEVIKFVPSATLRLDRKRCAADRVVCRDENKVRRFTTARKRSVQGRSIPDGSEIMPPDSQSFVEAGKLAFDHTQILLPADQVLDEIPCKAGAPVILTKGRVEGATLSSTLERRGFSWAEGTVWERIVAPRYERVTGTLAADRDVAGVPCRAGARLTVEVFEGSTSVRRATLARDWKGYGVLFAANTAISWEGDRLRGTLARDMLISRVPCLAGHELELDERQLLEATLSRAHVIDGIPCASGTMVRFANGKLQELTLSRRYRAAHEAFEAGVRLSIDQWGEPRRQRIVELMQSEMELTGARLLWGTANLFGHPRYMAGAATNPDPEVFASAAAQVKQMLEVTQRLGGENYVLWGGREGYDTLLNTDLRREAEQLARFLALVAEHKSKNRFSRHAVDPAQTDGAHETSV